MLGLITGWLLSCVVLEQAGTRYLARLPQVMIRFRPFLQQTWLTAIGAIANTFFAQLVEQQFALTNPLGQRRQRQLTVGRVDGLLGGRKAYLTRMHFLEQRCLARGLAN